jgi:hypothetical protein
MFIWGEFTFNIINYKSLPSLVFELGALKGHIRTISDTPLYLNEDFSEIRNLNRYRFEILLW